MRRAERPALVPARRGRQWVRTVVTVALVLGTVAAILFGLRYLDEFMRQVIGPRTRYEYRFADIDCNLPPATDRTTFLAEVRYVANFPESFHVLTQDDRERLGRRS